MRIISGEARGRSIDAPAGLHTRPTLDRVRENMFNMLQSEVPDSRVLDLFAGSGALSLEALSRGAAEAVLVDTDRNAHMTQRKNIERLRYTGRARTMHCDWKKALEALKAEKKTFDLVFLDPPYAMTDLSEVFTAVVPLIGPESLVILEYEAGKEITVPESFSRLKDRSWGFCAVSIFRITPQGG